MNRKTNLGQFHWNAGYLLAFIILLIFIGFRDNIGTDWNNYRRIFEGSIQQDFIFGESREIGFLSLINICHFFEVDFQVFVFVFCFITLLLFFFSFRKFYYLLPFAIFIFFMDIGYTLIINIMRQTFALFAFLCAISYIGEKGKLAFLKYLAFLSLGALFHYTILLFAPCWFIGKLRLKFSTLMLLCSAIFAFCFFYLISLYGDVIEAIPKYDHYSSPDDNIVNKKSTFGLGATLLLTLRFLPLIFYNNIRKENGGMIKYFVFYYFGLSVYYGFYNFLLVLRFTYYFQICELIVLACFMYYSMHSKLVRIKLLGLFFISMFIFNYVYTFDEFLANHQVSKEFSLLFMEFSI